MKVILDAGMCTGHGRCYSLAPEVFVPDDEGHSTLVRVDIPEALQDKALIGVHNCPEHAITVED